MTPPILDFRMTTAEFRRMISPPRLGERRFTLAASCSDRKIWVMPSMAEDLIRYDILAQDALRGVVRKVLAEVAKTGLPGEHHFYITFETRAPGVRVSSRLMADYPEDMTIILQHQFWDFSVTEQAFEVGLSFKGVPERLLIPYTAIKVFHDPSVQFTLQFETALADDDDAEGPTEIEEIETLPLILDRPKPEPAAAKLARRIETAEAKTSEAKSAESKADVKPSESKPADAQVVSLDAFRKKN
jgi:hypothetical protein